MDRGAEVPGIGGVVVALSRGGDPSVALWAGVGEEPVVDYGVVRLFTMRGVGGV